MSTYSPRWYGITHGRDPRMWDSFSALTHPFPMKFAFGNCLGINRLRINLKAPTITMISLSTTTKLTVQKEESNRLDWCTNSITVMWSENFHHPFQSRNLGRWQSKWLSIFRGMNGINFESILRFEVGCCWKCDSDKVRMPSGYLVAGIFPLL
jgi:hypothetical protein